MCFCENILNLLCIRPIERQVINIFANNRTNTFNPIHSVGAKLFLLFFSSILLFVLVVGFSSYSRSKQLLAANVSASNEQTFMQAGGKLELILQRYIKIAEQLSLDTNLKTRLGNIRHADVVSMEDTQAVQGILQNITFSNPEIVAAHLEEAGGNQRVIRSTSDELPLQEKPWFHEAATANGGLIWIDTDPAGIAAADGEHSDRASFGLARTITDNTQAQAYVLVLELDAGVIASEIAALSLGAGSGVAIANAAGQVIFAGDSAAIGSQAAFELTAQADAGVASGEAVIGGISNQTLDYSLRPMNWHLIGNVPVASVVKDAESIRSFTLLMATMALIVAVGIGLLVVRLVARPLVQLKDLLLEGEKGNLTIRSSHSGRDEIGQLSISFNRMMDNISQLVLQSNDLARNVLLTASRLTEASIRTTSSAKEIAIVTDEIARGATGLSMEAEKGSGISEMIGERVSGVIRANKQMGQAAMQVDEVSKQGTTYMADLMEKTAKTEEMSRSMVSSVNRLQESTRSIRRIMEMMESLTSQTNILSLNASIEAARAGAAGKGFMVVANEIRKLADQTKASIATVNTITETIHQEVESTVGLLSEAYPLYREQLSAVRDTSSLFDDVREQMDGVLEQLGAINHSIESLSESQAVLTDAMNNVSAVAQQSSASCEEVASLSTEQHTVSDALSSLAEELEQTSRQLAGALEQFKLE